MQWLEENAKEVELGPESRTPKTFIPREVYSRYLKSTLQKEARQSKKVDFREMHDEAVEARVLDDSAVQVFFEPREGQQYDCWILHLRRHIRDMESCNEAMNCPGQPFLSKAMIL